MILSLAAFLLTPSYNYRKLQKFLNHLSHLDLFNIARLSVMAVHHFYISAATFSTVQFFYQGDN